MQDQSIPPVLSLLIYSDLCLVLIVNTSVAEVVSILQNFRRNKSMDYSHVLFVLREKPMNFSLYYQVYHLHHLVTFYTTNFNIKKLCILPARCIYIFLCFSEHRANISLHHYLILFISETESIYCSVRTIYLTVIQVLFRVGRVNNVC